jgi:glycosyltransferase involved in cell wall biosynthesis
VNGRREKIRVLQVLPSFELGGAETIAVHLCEALDKTRFQVGAVSLSSPSKSDLENQLEEIGIPLWHLNKGRGFDPLLLLSFDRLLRTFDPRVIHTHLHVLKYTLLPSVLRRIPARVHTLHTLADMQVEASERMSHRLAVRLGVVLVPVAAQVAASIARVYGFRGGPVIPNGIPVARYAKPAISPGAWRGENGFRHDDVLFVCVARLGPPKNQRLLIDAFLEGAASDRRAHLLLVGDGPSRRDLEAQVDELRLRDRVHFLGWRTDIPEILAASDVFVLSSDFEGNPLAVLEALAAGKPVVATAVGGVPELVDDGETGTLVSTGDVPAFARAMGTLLADSELRERMGRFAGLRALRDFDIQAMARAYEELYEACLRKGGREPKKGPGRSSAHSF